MSVYIFINNRYNFFLDWYSVRGFITIFGLVLGMPKIFIESKMKQVEREFLNIQYNSVTHWMMRQNEKLNNMFDVEHWKLSAVHSMPCRQWWLMENGEKKGILRSPDKNGLKVSEKKRVRNNRLKKDCLI